MSQQLLDNEEDELVKAGLEAYLWEGAPNTSFFSTATTMGSYHGLMFTVVGLYLFLDNSSWMVAIFMMLLLALIPIIVLHYHNKGIKYYILKKGIYLQQLDWSWKPVSLFIAFDNIRRINVIPHPKKNEGTIIIVSKDTAVGPATVSRALPRLLDIKDAQNVATLILENIS